MIFFIPELSNHEPTDPTTTHLVRVRLAVALELGAQAGDGSSPAKYGTGSRRVTDAPAFDGLPAFSSDGGTMIWTSKRSGEDGSQLWVAGFDPEAGKTSASAPSGTSHGHP